MREEVREKGEEDRRRRTRAWRWSDYEERKGTARRNDWEKEEVDEESRASWRTKRSSQNGGEGKGQTR